MSQVFAFADGTVRTSTPDASTRVGAQYTSWLFGHRLRAASLMGSMGKVGCAYDNAPTESFWGAMQIELLERHHWTTWAELASAMFEWIKAFYSQRHSTHRKKPATSG